VAKSTVFDQSSASRLLDEPQFHHSGRQVGRALVTEPAAIAAE
jgi:hypothetical protein